MSRFRDLPELYGSAQVNSGASREGRALLASRARQRLLSGLDGVLGDDLRPVKGHKVDIFADGVVLSSHNLFDRPDSAEGPPAPFVESTYTARRRVGLLALRHLSSCRLRPEQLCLQIPGSIAAVIETPDGWPIGLRDWIEGLDPAGLAAVVAATTTWCEGVLRLIGDHPRIVWTDPQYPNAWVVPGRLIRLSVTIDAVLGTPASGERLLVIGDSTPLPTDRIRIGYTALVRSLSSTVAPERVTTGSPGRGEKVSVEVSEELLELAVDQVVQAVALSARSQSTDHQRIEDLS